MNANKLRQSFLDFFTSKQHLIVPSAPMVIKDDPTLMFTNAGMNQFKDIFLGNSPIVSPRIADSQKCLRVSGKHNDLEEVGHDTYHHTMFEMLGNWSFGDYFKAEAIEWAWEYLTDFLKINPNNLYATVFEGDANDNTEFDEEAYNLWKKFLPEERILMGNKKDNFWEMGESGPCGPCSEIHIDIRSDDEKAKLSGNELVNKDHPHVIEIWNLVFIQFNRKTNGSLELLPQKHVDTGMGFERLAMVVQGKQSNYDTDVFQPLISHVANLANLQYGNHEKADIAMRVIADHVRTIAFAIADGQLPSNNKAGYVIRRILRRAVRYGYTFLNQHEAFLHLLIPTLIESMGEAYPELIKQQQLIEKVIYEEEKSFLRTLATGIQLLQTIIQTHTKQNKSVISGKDAFTLYDTYGFPIDLTMLIARENNVDINLDEFTIELDKQKARARQATNISAGDWVELIPHATSSFEGYETLKTHAAIVKYRKVEAKGKSQYQIVFDTTPFYAESGGQVGDKGFFEANSKKIQIIDTQKENNLTVHITHELPEIIDNSFLLQVTESSRRQTEKNHSATHLLHYALQHVLGEHVEQKGSLVDSEKLRFDFSHFQKMTSEEIRKVEIIVNTLIRNNHSIQEFRNTPIETAKNMGAKALFGEKYGDTVRVIQFANSIELCGGTHVQATGEIGFFTIINEGAIAAGIRRIEAVTADRAQEIIFESFDTIAHIKETCKIQSDVAKHIDALLQENAQLKKKIEAVEKEQSKQIAARVRDNFEQHNSLNILIHELPESEAFALKDIVFNLKNTHNNYIIVLATKSEDKAQIAIAISPEIIERVQITAPELIKKIAHHIQGGGGGQAFFATAGGKNPQGIAAALQEAKRIISQINV